MSEEIKRIEINKKPSFTEQWYEGSIQYNEKEYKFWLINPVGVDENGRGYAPEIRWWFKRVPREVRMMYSYIIESFLQTLKIN